MQKMKILNPLHKRFLFVLLAAGIFNAILPIRGNPQTKEEPIKNKVYLELKVSKEQFYLHEKVPLILKLYASGYLLRDVQFPQLFHQDFSVYEFEAPVQKNETAGGIEFETFEFKSALSGKRAGRFDLGPVRLRCALLVRGGLYESKADEYFGASET
ncbi:MAG: hypothetical protein EHM36_02035, partial [Deltaproteobacteria bacterium]